MATVSAPAEPVSVVPTAIAPAAIAPATVAIAPAAVAIAPAVVPPAAIAPAVIPAAVVAAVPAVASMIVLGEESVSVPRESGQGKGCHHEYAEDDAKPLHGIGAPHY